MSGKDKQQYPDLLREVLPKRGLVYQESNPQLVLCKPKLLPLKSVTLEKLEKMQKDANAKAKEMQEEIEKEKEQMKSIDCTESLLAERVYHYPHYTEVAPCACDLTPGKCDTYCCCDANCTTEARGSFPCIGGLQGGIDEGKIGEKNCSRTLTPFDSPFHSFVCIYQENSPYLGEYYDIPPKIETLSGYDQQMAKVESKPASFEEKGSWEQSENNTEHYKFGVSVKTLYDRREGVLGKLSLPLQSFNGGCVSSPIRFLKKSKSVCTNQLSSEVCLKAKNTLLDHQMYIMSFPGITNAPNFAQVLIKNNFLETAETKVNYYTTSSTEKYLNVNPDENIPHKTDNLNEIFDKLSRIRKDIKFKENIDNDDISKYEKLQNVAHYDPEENACKNLVLEARYEFFWSGFEILEVHVDILLGNISLSNIERDDSDLYIRQYFQVDFTHINKSRQEKRPKSLRSGNPGYLSGKPLIFANSELNLNVTENESDDKFNNETVKRDLGGFKIWGENKHSSLCQENLLSDVHFEQNTITGCFIRLIEEQLEKCDILSQDLLSLQRKMLRSSLVAKDGTLNFTNANSFIPIIYESKPRKHLAKLFSPLTSCRVPSSVRVTILLTNSGDIKTLNGVRVTPHYEEWFWKCKMSTRGSQSCPKIQKFMLRTEVEFVEIPVVWHHTNTTRFWLKQDSISCNGDICWEDMLSPITRLDSGDMIAEMVEWFFVLVLMLVPTLYFACLKQ